MFGCDGFVTGVALGRPCAEAMVESQPKVVRSTLTKGFSMGIFKDENGRSYGDWTHRGQGRIALHQLLYISCFKPIASSMQQPQGSNLLRKPALYQQMLSRKEKGADQERCLEGV